MEGIAIFNYGTGEIYWDILTDEDKLLLESNIDEWFKSYNMNLDECSWMFTNEFPGIKSFRE